MRIEINEEGIKILDNHCWRCGKKENITGHHGIPRCLDPKKNVNLPICLDCHDEINEIDLQGIFRFLYKVCRQIDDLTFFLRFDKWRKGTGKRRLSDGK